MTLSPRTISIVIALLLSGSFIALGYYFSSPLSPRFADAESTEELLKAYAEKDTDADGLPDWQESLYGTDPQNAHSTGPDMTDAEAVANGTVKPRFVSEVSPSKTSTNAEGEFDVAAPAEGSVTEEFGRKFFTEYLMSGIQEPDAGINEAFVGSAVRDLQATAAKKLASSYTTTSVRSSPIVTITQYVEAIEKVILAHPVPDAAADPSVLIEARISQGDLSANQKLTTLAKSYEGTAIDLARIEVPTRFVQTHLSLIRSFDLLAKATYAVANYDSDPLLTVTALGMFEPTMTEVGTTLRTITTTFVTEAGEPTFGAAGAFLLSLVRTDTTP